MCLLFDGVLSGDHHERLGKFDSLASDGGGAFGHGLQHGGLGFRIGSVDFVEQHEIGVDRSDLRGEALGGEIEHLGSHKVRRHEVRRALHAFERTGDGGGQRLCGCRLRQAGHRFYENMAAGHQGGDQGFSQIGLADKRLRESRADAVDQPTGPFRIVS